MEEGELLDGPAQSKLGSKPDTCYRILKNLVKQNFRGQCCGTVGQVHCAMPTSHEVTNSSPTCSRLLSPGFSLAQSWGVN